MCRTFDVAASFLDCSLFIVFPVLFQLVVSVLAKKPGGDRIVKEYNRTKGVTDSSRRQMVNILAADMTESHG